MIVIWDEWTCRSLLARYLQNIHIYVEPSDEVQLLYGNVVLRSIRAFWLVLIT